MESTDGTTSVQQPADAELHRRLVYGDESALAEAYGAYGGLVRAVAVRVTRSGAAAEDVAQEVFAQLWSRPYAFDARRGSLRTWLSLLAHRRAVDWVRSEARHRKDARADDLALHGIPDASPGPAEAVVDRERALLLHTALAELPQPQREVVHLAYFAGRTYRQAAVEPRHPRGHREDPAAHRPARPGGDFGRPTRPGVGRGRMMAAGKDREGGER